MHLIGVLADYRVSASLNEDTGMWTVKAEEVDLETDLYLPSKAALANTVQLAALMALCIGFGEERYVKDTPDPTTAELYRIAEEWYVANPHMPRFIP